MRGSQWWANEVPEDLGEGYVKAILKAIEDGHAILRWQSLAIGDLELLVMRAPLAIGTSEDYVYLYGLSANACDRIAEALTDVMTPTSLVLDALAEHPDAEFIGPHTQPNGATGMSKAAAKAHNDEVQEDERLIRAGAIPVGYGKTYVLNPRYREGYACEYWWPVSEDFARANAAWLPGGGVNSSGTGYVVQPEQWAHFYLHFWDYSMGAFFMATAARLAGEPVDLRQLVQDPSEAGRISLWGALPWSCHPEFKPAGESPSEPIAWHTELDLTKTPLGLRCVTWLGYQFGLAPREIPGPRHDPMILSYSKHCRRGGKFLGVDLEGLPVWDGGIQLALPSDDRESPWCAALASETLRACLLPGEVPPHGLRVSVRELVEDARLARSLRPKEWTPTPGSLAICARAGHDPLRGGFGHVRGVVQAEGGRYLGIGGNELDTITMAWHSLTAKDIRAWIKR